MSDNIAHDLKSPITRIRGLSEVSLTTGASLTEYGEMAASTIEECDRLLDMINTMLFISKTEAGVRQLEKKKLDIGAVICDACDLFQSAAEDKGLTMVCHVDENISVDADMRLIQRMIANLLDNAIKYTLPDGRVDVSVHTESRAKTCHIFLSVFIAAIPADRKVAPGWASVLPALWPVPMAAISS